MASVHGIERLVERQVRLWEERRAIARQGDAAAREALVHLPEGPWITVSRPKGTGGGELARRLAARLGWQVFDREILALIARATHTTEDALRDLDEHAVSRLREILAHFMLNDVSDQAVYVRELTRVIWTLARQGKAILLGRGAHCVLDARYGLRVRLTSPLETRVERVVEAERVPRAEAERRVRESDAEIAGFVRRYFRRDIEDPVDYDLVLNVSTLGLDAATDIVLAALRGKLDAAA